ncbi:SMR family transporter [uncultured Roseibium sp.]|uniref:DMT family transporter n=1 Tax=uncultured Roseibium sp. TaxID=1936171 RepID=UPI003217775E
MPWLFLILAILAEVVATSALKASNGMTHWPASHPDRVRICGLVLLSGPAFRVIPLGVAYAVWAGLGHRRRDPDRRLLVRAIAQTCGALSALP